MSGTQQHQKGQQMSSSLRDVQGIGPINQLANLDFSTQARKVDLFAPNDPKLGYVGGGLPQKRSLQQQSIKSKIDDDGYIEENEDDDNDEETFAEKDDDFKGMQAGANGIATSIDNQTFSLPPSEPKKLLPDSLQMLAMPLPLVAAGHSLMPDMQFGWKPQADKEIPPIPFCFGLVNYNLEQFNYPKALYVGPRFTNSYKMHEQYANKLMKLPIQREDGENMSVQAYPFTFPKFYDSKNPAYEEAFNQFVESMEFDSSIMDQNLKFAIPSSQVQNGKRGDQNSILSAISYKDEREEFTFDSNFESGNLDFVGKVADNEFDLLMRLDSNSRSHQQWFYFSIDCKDIKKRSTKGETIKINIMNFTKPNSLYNQGMRPVAWSKMKCMQEGMGWHRVGQNITYKLSKLCRQNFSGGGYNRIWYQMTFEYTFEFDNDKIWFAYAIPYSFTMLSNFIKAIETIQAKPENIKSSNIFKKESLGKSLSGVEIPLLTITDFSEKNSRKKTIVMVGRLHPGETHSSWLIHGFIRFLLSDSPKARELRKKCVFKIVPMLNPDGVIIGNYRCTLAGCDMNRNFGDSQTAQRLNPETLLFKKMAKQQNRTAFFFDVHSHSSKKSIFIYGPYFPLHSEHYLKIRVMPRLLAEKTTMFRYYSCRFRNEKHKMHCSRLTIFRECNLPQCYTIETSIMGFLSKDRQNVSFGVPSLQYFGEKLGETLLDWFQILEAHQREKIKKAIMMSRQRKTRKRTIIDIIGEEDYLEFRDVIDNQIYLQQQEEEQSVAQESQILKGKKSKKSVSLKRKQTGKSLNRRKTLVGSQMGAGLLSETNKGGDQSVKNRQNSPSKELDNIQVNSIFDIKPQSNLLGDQGKSKKNSSAKKKQESSDEDREEEEEEEDDDYGPSNNHQEPQKLQPKIHPSQKPKPLGMFDILSNATGDQQAAEDINRGFYVPKLAGFEYLEGPELLQKAAKELKVQLKLASTGQRNASIFGSKMNGDILLSNSDLGKFNIQDDDEQFIFEDQAHSQEGDQKIRRLEDIVGDIKKDLIKANSGANNVGIPGASSKFDQDNNQQFYDEKDLDSQRSEGKDDVNDLDADYDAQMQKMQERLVSYFDNVEEFANMSSSRLSKQVQSQPVKKQPIQPPAQKEVKKALPVEQPIVKVSPIKVSRQPVQATVKHEVFVPQKKEIVFQLKKPAITNFPPDKPAKQSAMMQRQPHIHNYPPQLYPSTQQAYSSQQTYMHYKGSSQSPINQVTTTTTTTIPITDPKDLSFTLMNKTNQEFFDLLQKYVHTEGPAQGMQLSVQSLNMNQAQLQRASSAVGQRQPLMSQSSLFGKHLMNNKQNQQLLHHMQLQQQCTQGGEIISSRNPSGLATTNKPNHHPGGTNISIPRVPMVITSPELENTIVNNNTPSLHFNDSMINIETLQHHSQLSGVKVENLKQRQGLINSSQQLVQHHQLTKGSKGASGQASLQIKSESESPHKHRKLIEQSKQNFKGAASNNNLLAKAKLQQSERGKKFILMIDGRGVSQGGNESALQSSMSGTHVKQVMGIHQIHHNSNPAQVYENSQLFRHQQNLSKSQTGIPHKKSTYKNRPQSFKPQHLRQTDFSLDNNLNAMSQNNLNFSQVEQQIPEELTPSKRFMHSRHSSNSQQAQMFENGFRMTGGIYNRKNSSPKNNLISDPSPSNLTRQFLSSNTEDSISPQKQRAHTSLMIIPEKNHTNKRDIFLLNASAVNPASFYQPEEDVGEDFVKTDSARFYQHHLNNYLEDSSTGFQIQGINEHSSSPANQRSKFLKPNFKMQSKEAKKNGAGHQYYGPQQQDIIKSASGAAIALHRPSTQSSIHPQQESPVKGFRPQNVRIRQSAQQQQQQQQLPMRNQLLIDMFRQANCVSQQASSQQQQRGALVSAVKPNSFIAHISPEKGHAKLSGRGSSAIPMTEVKQRQQPLNRQDSGMTFSISPDKRVTTQQQQLSNRIIVPHNATS